MSDSLSPVSLGGYTLISVGLPDLLPQADLRTPGPHVKVIIDYICVRLGYQEEYDASESIPPSAMSRMQLGCAFEDTLAERFKQDDPNRYFRPGEIEKDGIYGHPDLIDCVDGAVEELKLTWLSAAKHKPGSRAFWKFEVQLKAYCHMLDLPLGRLRVCHINGDYKWTKSAESGVYVPTYKRQFTDRELRDNWEMLLTNADKVKERG